MDKYEYKVRASEIKQLIEQEEYAQAAEIADTIDWRRVKSVMMLCMISDLYKINRRYEDARDMLLLAYERRPGGRTICYSLCELSIKMEEYVQAIEYYKEYVQATSSPKDTGRYILQYKLYEAQDVSLEERIAVLEKLKQCDYIPKWGYELAYLYHRVGLAARCVEECDELILWFGDGKYVIKAMELKMLHQPLTPDQQEKYDHRFDDLYAAQMPAEEPNQEEVYAEGADVPGEQQLTEDTQIYSPLQNEADQQDFGDTQIYAGVQSEADIPEQPEEMDIHVKTMDVGQYNTINLQAELAAGLREVLAEEKTASHIDNPITRSIVAPMMESDTEALDYPEIDEVSEEDLGPVVENLESSEVFFGETGEISSFQAEMGLVMEEPVSEEDAIAEPVAEESVLEESAPEENVTEESSMEEPTTVPDVTAEIVMEQLRQENTISAEPQENTASEEPQVTEEAQEVVSEKAEAVQIEDSQTAGVKYVVNPQAAAAMNVEPPKSLANVLSQESDGQISLVMPERESIEKQITGQISLEDILAEWERMKKENQEKREAEVRQHVLQQTGTMFTEFEAAVRDGLLEQLERGKNIEGITDAPVEDDILPEEEPVEYEMSVEEEVSAEYEMPVEEETFAEDVITEADEVEELEEIQEEVAPEDFVGTEVVEEEYIEGDSEAVFVEEEYPETEVVAEEYVEETYPEAEIVTEEFSEETYPEAEVVAEEFAEETYPEAEVVAEEFAEEAVPETEAVEEVAEEATKVVQQKTPVVEREKAKVRALTREEKELFAPFIQSRAAREQLVKAIDSISLAAYTGNVIITGEEGMDTLSLAKNMIREVRAADSNFSGKVAKISGQALNKKDVTATIGQLKNGALIIAKASEMNKNTVNALHKSLQQESTGIVIVLEDTKRAIDKFLAENEQLKGSFTARMDVEALSNDMLVAFGKQYAREREYFIDELGVLALHTRIEDMQTIDHAVTVVEVKEIVDEAINHANRKTIGHFFDILFAKRYDEEDMIILSEKDFV